MVILPRTPSRSFTASQHRATARAGTLGALGPGTRGADAMAGARAPLHRRLVPVLAVVLSLVWAAGARAETYGELGHFGSVGAGRGQFTIAGSPSKGTHAFGVDPTDNSVYVGDEPVNRHYRIQKLTPSGQFLAQTPTLVPPNRDGIEGIAVDTADKRIYMLALERRSQTAKLDPAQPVAGTLYAFSTEASGESLVPAPGTNSEGVLTGPKEFEAESEVPGKALLRPSGIAVDPSSHDVIVLGEAEGVPGEEEQPHGALERVHSNGSIGARYVDSSGILNPVAFPNSPVVTPGGAVYVPLAQAQRRENKNTHEIEEFDSMVKIPSDFTSASPPTNFVEFVNQGASETRPVAQFDSSEIAKEGGGASLAPPAPGEAGEGRIYTKAQVFDQKGVGYPGVLAFDGADGLEVGWTGGQSRQVSENCNIGFGGLIYSQLAAGSEEKLFVLSVTATTTRVVEFGPGGKGCPAAEASEPTATVAGKPLSPSEVISPGTPVTFSSTMTQSNALSVEWNFGDGKTAGHAPSASAPPAPPVVPPAAVAPAPVPAAGLVSTSLAASRAGTVKLVVTCPTGETSCSGTVTLRTLSPVVVGMRASRSHAKQRSKPKVLTLASGSFTLAGGDQKTLALRLTAGARSLLGRSHELRARATIVAQDPAKAVHSTELTVTLLAVKAAPRHR